MTGLRGGGPKPGHGKGFWIGLVLASPILAYGLRGAHADLPGVQLTSAITYFVGGAVVHDLALAPLVCVIGWLVLRFVPGVAVAPVQVALIVSGIVGLVSWPFVRGYGITEGEPSFLSRNYTVSVLTVWGAVWVTAALVIGIRVISARRR